jgi:hypothetical protein
MNTKKEKTDKTNSGEVTALKPYYFGSIEILTFEQLNLPEHEISIFASADIVDGGRGGSGPGDAFRRAYTI